MVYKLARDYLCFSCGGTWTVEPEPSYNEEEAAEAGLEVKAIPEGYIDSCPFCDSHSIDEQPTL